MSQALSLILLLVLSLAPCRVSSAPREELTAQHFALLVSAAQNTILPQAQKARRAEAGEMWLGDCPACLTPLKQSLCDPSLDLLSHSNQFLHLDRARFHIHIQHGLCYIYGTVDKKEMAAIRRSLRGSLALSFCPKGAQNGLHCLPGLLDDQGSALPLPGNASEKDTVIHVFRLTP